MRYARKPRAETAEQLAETPLLPHLIVHDHEAIDVGILDADGWPLVRYPNPIGFIELVERD